MRILHLGLQGFGAYKTETKIDFTEINQAVILGENAGKSTLIDGIAFALFGVTRTRQLDEMISTGGEKAVASLVFSVDDSVFEIVRTRRCLSGKGSSTCVVTDITVAGSYEVLAEGNVRAADAIIKDILGLDYDMFAATVLSSQGDMARFAESDPAPRKELLNEILGLGIYSEYSSIVQGRLKSALQRSTHLAGSIESYMVRKDEAKATSEKLETLTGTLEVLKKDIAAKDAEIVVAKKVLAEADESLAAIHKMVAEKMIDARLAHTQGIADASAAQLLITRLENEQKSLTGRLAEREKAAIELEKSIATLLTVSESTSSFDFTLNALENQLNRGLNLAATQKARLVVLIERKELLGKVSEDQSVCPACEQEIDAEHQAHLLDDVAEQISFLETEIEETVSANENLQLNMKETKQDISDTNQQIMLLNRSIERNSEIVESGENLENMIEDTKQQLAEANIVFDTANDIVKHNEQLIDAAQVDDRAERDAVNDANDNLMRLNSELKVLEKEEASKSGEKNALEATMKVHNEALVALAECEEEYKVVENEADLLKDLLRAFSRDGVPAIILSNIIPSLTDDISDILRQLTDGRLSLELSTEGKSGLDIIINDGISNRSYASFSGGERLRINLALRVGLSRLLSRRSGKKVRTLIVDEGFGALDADGITAVVDCLIRLKNEFDLILVVTHIPELGNSFPTVIRAVNELGGSQVNVTTGTSV